MATISPLVAVVGETASGKSALAIVLAKQFKGEIICADSRTVYRGMDIGTAKPTINEREEVPHHLLDVVDLDQMFTVADFKRLANEAIQDISRRGRLPILVGGSGLYVDSVLFDYQFAGHGAERDKQNPRHLKNQSTSQADQLRANTLVIGLSPDRDALRQRVVRRVEQMINDGFIDELQRLSKQYGWQHKALDAPGYRAFRRYLQGDVSLADAKQQFIQNDLHLAKRQRTWFRRNKNIQWLERPEQATQLVEHFLHNNLLQ